MDESILEYIRTSLKKGSSEESVRAALSGAGWKSADIEEAILSVRGNQPVYFPVPQRIFLKPVWLTFIVAAVLVTAGVTAYVLAKPDLGAYFQRRSGGLDFKNGTEVFNALSASYDAVKTFRFESSLFDEDNERERAIQPLFRGEAVLPNAMSVRSLKDMDLPEEMRMVDGKVYSFGYSPSSFSKDWFVWPDSQAESCSRTGEQYYCMPVARTPGRWLALDYASDLRYEGEAEGLYHYSIAQAEFNAEHKPSGIAYNSFLLGYGGIFYFNPNSLVIFALSGGEVWVDKDARLRRERYTLVMDISKLTGSGPENVIVIEIAYSDYNESFSIEIPAAKKPSPAKTHNQTLDDQRITDLGLLKNLISLYLADGAGPQICESKRTFYASARITPPPGWTLGGNPGSKAVDGTGWIPINFNEISTGSPVPALMVDPLNDPAQKFVYVLACDPANDAFEFNARLQFPEYGYKGQKDVVSTDGGNDPEVLEVGLILNLLPKDFLK